MTDTCRCHLPSGAPDGPHWWPSRDPEPGPEVQAVALLGRDPSILRYVRVRDGWHNQGAAASYADLTRRNRGRRWAAAGTVSSIPWWT